MTSNDHQRALASARHQGAVMASKFLNELARYAESMYRGCPFKISPGAVLTAKREMDDFIKELARCALNAYAPKPDDEPQSLVDLSQFEPIGDGQWILDVVRKQREWLVTDGILCERAYSWKSSKGLRWTALPYQPCQECQCEAHVYSPTVYVHFTPTHARPVC